MGDICQEDISPQQMKLLETLDRDAKEQVLFHGEVAEGGPAKRTRAATRKQQVSVDGVGRGTKRRADEGLIESAPSTKQRSGNAIQVPATPPRQQSKAKPPSPPNHAHEACSQTPRKPRPTATPISPASPASSVASPSEHALLRPADVSPIIINRAPVLCLWAASVADREGWEWKTCLSIGKAITTMFAQSKGKSLGIFEKEHGLASRHAKNEGDGDGKVNVFGTRLTVVQKPSGPRAELDGKILDPVETEWYLRDKFGARYEDARRAFKHLAHQFPPESIGSCGYRLYEQFRPVVSSGVKGWGKAGELDLDFVMKLGACRDSL
ncbi:hypothetical protein SpCBS45565_g05198 [Spizellomyces sp. 'palustris']|nr:hypothetical protein SpCBS45565_g05198 [Spizellomyces sp. 'palustris']